MKTGSNIVYKSAQY